MASPVLPDDIMYYNILPRLPFRTLMRFTAVCKAWRHSIWGNDAFAALQAQNPSPASVAIAWCLQGRLRILSPNSADVQPRNNYLSFVEVHHHNLSFCASIGGVLCLMERPDPDNNRHRCSLVGNPEEHVCNFFVINPNRTTHKIRRVPYEGFGVTAGLAYDADTVSRKGFQIVVPVIEDGGRCRFRKFTSQRAVWSESQEAFALPPPEEFQPKPAYASGRVHWLTGDVVVWYDLGDDRAGTTRLPAAGNGKECDDNHHDLGAWRGQLRLTRVNTLGVWVWELAGGESAAGARAWRWEMLRSRLWEKVPGFICPGTVVMEAGGEKAVSVAVRMKCEGDDPTKKTPSRQGLLRYDMRTGQSLTMLKLSEHPQMGLLVDYHSSMAKLPDIAWDRRKHPRTGRKSLWGA